LVASPFNQNISGFAAPIGGHGDRSGIDPSESNSPTANPIWSGLKTAGKKVVAATFPGADGEYLYNLDPAAVTPSVKPDGTNNFVTAGLVALTALDNNGNILEIERSFSATAANTPLTPETSNTIKIYQLHVGDATDISNIDSLNALSTDDLGKIKPVQKNLLLNLNDLKPVGKSPPPIWQLLIVFKLPLPRIPVRFQICYLITASAPIDQIYSTRLIAILMTI
jgi:Esterase-like activity of phytase